MDPISVLPEGSDVSIESEDEGEVKVDPFQSSTPTWATRYHCLQAYCCFVLSYLTTLKFCLTVGKYGFVIFIPYWAYNLFYGVSSVLVEIHLGRYVIGPVSRAWDMCPLSKGGWLSLWRTVQTKDAIRILWCLFGTTFFTVVHDYLSNSYLLKYLFWSFRGDLPWQSCDNPWNNEMCYEVGKKASAISKCKAQHSDSYCQNIQWEMSGQQFWKYRVRATDEISSIAWSMTGLAVSVLLSFIVNYKGIRSIEKLFPLFVYPTIALWLLLSCVTFVVPKAFSGFILLWDFEWNYLITADIWLDGFNDIVYYLGLGKLTLSFISSHGRFDDNILLDVLIASFGSLFVCALTITPVLSIITSIRKDEGVSKDENTFKGIDHIFVYMSEALSYYPYPKGLWAILTYLNWFLMSTSAQALSVLGIIEAIQGLLKNRPNTFFWTAFVLALISFGTSSLFTFFPVLFEINLGPSTSTILLLITFTWQHCYGIFRFNKDYYFMMGSPLPIFLKGCWFCTWSFPVIVIFLCLLYRIPNTPIPGMIYIYTSIPVAVYVFTMFYQIISFRRAKRPIAEVFKPNPNWGPENPNLRKSRIVFDSATASKELLYRQELCNRPFKRPPEFSEQNIVQLI